MSFKNEQFNKNKGVDVLEEEISKEGVSENKKEGINTDQDPSLGGILTEKEILQNRKHLSELIDKASKKGKENDKEELLKIKKEINEIIGRKKEE